MITEDISIAVPVVMEAGPFAPGHDTPPANPAVPSVASGRGVNPTHSDEQIWMIAARVAASS